MHTCTHTYIHACTSMHACRFFRRKMMIEEEQKVVIFNNESDVRVGVGVGVSSYIYMVDIHSIGGLRFLKA